MLPPRELQNPLPPPVMAPIPIGPVPSNPGMMHLLSGFHFFDSGPDLLQFRLQYVRMIPQEIKLLL
jgi:hypothetical protein